MLKTEPGTELVPYKDELLLPLDPPEMFSTLLQMYTSSKPTFKKSDILLPISGLTHSVSNTGIY